MSDNSVDKTPTLDTSPEGVKRFLQELREFSVTVGEPCPEGHRLDPSSGRCLPMGSIDHTAETRSVNVDDGPEWRGERDKTNITFASEQEAAQDADDMDEPKSCAEGTTFSFVQRKCISVEEAELENADETPMGEEDAAAPGVGGHPEITQMQPEGRRDTVNHECPANQFFDYVRRECIPLNKDTVMASENKEFTEAFKKEVARFGKVAKTSPDPIDGHRHFVTTNEEGDGNTSVDVGGIMESYAHSHKVVEFEVAPHKVAKSDYVSRHPGAVNPFERDDEETVSIPFGSASDKKEEGAPIKTKQRNALPASAFGVPGKRKFPLDSCGRVRNAMARFNQAKGLTSSEKATLRRKILARAKTCDIEVRAFGKASTDADFAEILLELVASMKEDRLDLYRSDEAKQQGPCPPGMVWATEDRRCTQMRGFVDGLKDEAQHADIISKDPEGRRDTLGFQCPEGWFFDFSNRRCLPLDPSNKPGTTTTKAEVEDAQRDLAPSPAGRPARLPQDCPKDTIWDKDLEICKPLDSRKKTKSDEDEAAIPPQFLKNIKKKKGKNGDDKNGKDGKKGGFPDFLKKKKSKSEEEDGAGHPELPSFIKKMIDKKKKKAKSEEEEDAAKHGQTTTNGPGKKGGPGCPEGQFMNPITKKCMPRKGAFKGKSEQEDADAKPQNRVGLTPAPAGKVQHQTDCPPNTAWDAKSKVCRPIDSRDKNRPDGASPQASTSVAEEVEMLSIHQLIQKLDEVIQKETSENPNKEKSRVAAKDLPNAAFPPSLVSPAKRSLMHHGDNVEDPYDHGSVNVGRLRNSLARASGVEGFSEKAVVDAQEHLLYHARAIVAEHLEKKD